MPAKPASLVDTSRRIAAPWGMIVLTAGVSGVILGVLLFAWRYRDGTLIEIRLEVDDTLTLLGKRLQKINHQTVPVPGVATASTTPPPAPKLARPIVRQVEPRLPRDMIWRIASKAVQLAIVDDFRASRDWLRALLQGSRRRVQL